MTLELPTLSQDVLTVEGAFEGDTITVRFIGTADVETRPDLPMILRKLHEEAQRLLAAKVVIDFRRLEFMNSSSFKAFVGWLALVQDSPPEKQYRIHLLADPNLHWQRRSLAALSCFAVDLVTIEM